MNKNVWIGLGIAAVLFVSLPLLAQLKRQSAAPAAAPAGETSAPAAAQAPLQAPQLNAANLTGTAWNAKGYVVQLGAGGVATANTPFGAVSGTWSVSGSTLTISAMGKTITGQISGDQILVDGQPAQRAQ